jgi:hypothetical protein
MSATYDCLNDGVPKPERRKFTRGPADKRVESLFNGFENAIRNLSPEGREPYWGGYLKGMRDAFATLLRDRDAGALAVAAGFPIRGVRVEGDTVIVSVKGGNDAARLVCGAIVEGMAQTGPRAYVDSTPQLHVGSSSFESWFQAQPFATQSGIKQISRDSYAAGMGDPLVVARPGTDWIDYSETRPVGADRRMLVDSSWGVREAHWVERFQNFQDVGTQNDEGMYAESDGEPFVVRFWREHPAPSSPAESYRCPTCGSDTPCASCENAIGGGRV